MFQFAWIYIVLEAKVRETQKVRDKMGYNSFLRSPKKEEQQVPDSVLTKISNTKDAYDDEEFDIMDELEGIWGFEGDEKFPQDNKYDHQLSWDFMDWEGFPKREGEDEDEEEQKVFENTKQCFFEEEESYYSKDIKRENIGVLDDDEMRASLNLNLNYEEVLDAWSNRGSLWADDSSPSMASNGNYVSSHFNLYISLFLDLYLSVFNFSEKKS
jgi:hypothetical protein